MSGEKKLLSKEFPLRNREIENMNRAAARWETEQEEVDRYEASIPTAELQKNKKTGKWEMGR